MNTCKKIQLSINYVKKKKNKNTLHDKRFLSSGIPEQPEAVVNIVMPMTRSYIC